jgi:integrase
MEHAGPRVWFAIFLTGAFGLRCSEALALRRGDISLQGPVPKARVTGEERGARKSPGDVYVRKKHLKIMKDVLKDGITVKRTKRHKFAKGREKKIAATKPSRSRPRASFSRGEAEVVAWATMPCTCMSCARPLTSPDTSKAWATRSPRRWRSYGHTRAEPP